MWENFETAKVQSRTAVGNLMALPRLQASNDQGAG